MALSPKRRGKQLEEEFGQGARALKNDRHLPIAYWNSNDPKPCCDGRLTFFGASVLVECKETRGERFVRSEFTEAERTHLDSHHEAGGLGVVAIKRIEGSRSRLWCVSWLAWTRMEAAGVRGISLLDGQRPPELREVFRVTRPQGLGRAWDLEPFLAASVVDYLERNLKQSRARCAQLLTAQMLGGAR